MPRYLSDRQIFVLIKGKTQLLAGGMTHLSENCVLNVKNKSHSVTAQIVVPQGGAEGVIDSDMDRRVTACEGSR